MQMVEHQHHELLDFMTGLISKTDLMDGSPDRSAFLTSPLLPEFQVSEDSLRGSLKKMSSCDMTQMRQDMCKESQRARDMASQYHRMSLDSSCSDSAKTYPFYRCVAQKNR